MFVEESGLIILMSTKLHRCDPLAVSLPSPLGDQHHMVTQYDVQAASEEDETRRLVQWGLEVGDKTATSAFRG